MYSKILVPLDGSKRAERILPHVSELARCLQARIVFLQVIDPTSEVIGPRYTAIDLTPALLERNEAEAITYINRLQEEYKKLGFEVKGCVERGPVVNTIIHIAEREGADLIAIASHGRTGLARVFYGSVAAGVLHRADRPLLLIRAEGEE